MRSLRIVVKQFNFGNGSINHQKPLFRIVWRPGNYDGVSGCRRAAAGMHIRHRELAAVATHAFAAFMLVRRHFNAWYQAEKIRRYEPGTDQG